MEKIEKIFEKCIEYLMALTLAIMFFAVFINVILRYFFGSSFSASEELSRFLFVWLIFFGATLAVGKNAHISFDIVQNKLPKSIKSICFIVARIIMLYGLYLFLMGSWDQYEIGWGITSTIIKYPLAYLYASGLFASVCMGFYILRDLIKESMLIKKRLTANPVDDSDKKHKGRKL